MLRKNTIDRNAQKMEVSGCEWNSWDQVREILEGAEEILYSEYDNDAEAWYFTRAGQFVRVCGLDQDRYYIWEEDAAADELAGTLYKDQWEQFFGSFLPSREFIAGMFRE